MAKDDRDPERPSDERPADPDRAAILARRQRFIALALSGLAGAVACDRGKPFACLEIAEPPGKDEGKDPKDPTKGEPMPCLSPMPPPDEPPPQPCLEVMPPEDTKGDPHPCLMVAKPQEDPKAEPRPCLNVAQPPEEPPPQPCLKVAPKDPPPKDPPPQPCLKMAPKSDPDPKP